ncbi:hypothetical protein DICPUDRAFT_92807 [Dictyostelium purpureum]|uniref:Uncharacterized protein n=1 Tax=Dictyostelium purpureum TaxID=5786 RepID=F0ZXH2_DICPU|nr:uncharacterized protein DICPUDRAFT_92807 [Dictyostelium purpureum]EGC31363.1 hypothetical protein DICPUDRAFT_92807 [Dictyostelium purpureum]|eukprot:XP_003292111.1 hypothetical protein DICPUDRAFT_92807 [Dictyostelium purpureum]
MYKIILILIFVIFYSFNLVFSLDVKEYYRNGRFYNLEKKQGDLKFIKKSHVNSPNSLYFTDDNYLYYHEISDYTVSNKVLEVSPDLKIITMKSNYSITFNNNNDNYTFKDSIQKDFLNNDVILMDILNEGLTNYDIRYDTFYKKCDRGNLKLDGIVVGMDYKWNEKVNTTFFAISLADILIPRKSYKKIVTDIPISINQLSKFKSHYDKINNIYYCLIINESTKMKSLVYYNIDLKILTSMDIDLSHNSHHLDFDTISMSSINDNVNKIYIMGWNSLEKKTIIHSFDLGDHKLRIVHKDEGYPSVIFKSENPNYLVYHCNKSNTLTVFNSNTKEINHYFFSINTSIKSAYAIFQQKEMYHKNNQNIINLIITSFGFFFIFKFLLILYHFI